MLSKIPKIFKCRAASYLCHVRLKYGHNISCEFESNMPKKVVHLIIFCIFQIINPKMSKNQKVSFDSMRLIYRYANMLNIDTTSY